MYRQPPWLFRWLEIRIFQPSHRVPLLWLVLPSFQVIPLVADNTYNLECWSNPPALLNDQPHDPPQHVLVLRLHELTKAVQTHRQWRKYSGDWSG